MNWFRNIVFPLRATLVSAVILSALLATAITLVSTAAPSYYSIKKAVGDLWLDIAKKDAIIGTEKTLRYFESAPSSLKLIKGLEEKELLDEKTTFDYFNTCYELLEKNPNFSAVYYVTIDGAFTGVFREKAGFRGSFRSLQPDGITQEKDYTQVNGSWKELSQKRSDYDPRKRPFWKVASEHPDGSWSKVYTFESNNKQGYTFTLARNQKNKAIGFWAVDYEIDELSKFLGDLTVGDQGKSYLLSNDQNIIVSSVGELKDQALFKELHISGELFKKERKKILYAKEFPKSSHIPWTFVSIIHKEDYLTPIRNRAIYYVGIGLFPLLLFLAFSAIFFERISNRLKETAKEMSDVGNLNIEFTDTKSKRSKIREINLMAHSLHKMKVGLYSFLKYAPIDLVKTLIAKGKKAELGAEEKEVTILFADLMDFTSTSELLEPDETAFILKNFLSLVTQEVYNNKGIIDKFIGDAVMALWGAPIDLKEHAFYACKMALAMKKLTKEHPLLKHKIGINTGVVKVGNFGSERRMDFTAIGDAVNVASRLEKLNSYYETHILIGEETAKQVQEAFILRPIDYALLKGKKLVNLVHELIDEKSERVPEGVIIYTKALSLYRESDFVSAKELFLKAKVAFGGKDKPSDILALRCDEFQKTPPPPNWNGAALQVEKEYH